ncbi:MAG: lipocalin family protein [Arenimonas sp.]|nr:lipocalin family protein [Arenimonas sp.]
MSKFIAAVIVLGLAFAAYSFASSRKASPLVSSAQIDLPKYMGRWWVIANIPYFAENGKVATADIYALKTNGRIDNVFAYRKAFDQPEQNMQAEARILPGTNNTHWQVRFWGGLIRAQLVILEVSTDYQWALIGNPDRSLAWVFARDPIMDDAQLKVLTQKLRAHGYNPADLKRVPQAPDQLPATN